MADKETLRDGLVDNFVRSIKGAANATRAKFMTPAERDKFADRVIAKRKKRSKRKTPERAARDAIRARDINEGLDLRSELDPNAATKRRLKKAGQ